MFGQESSLNDSDISRIAGISWLISAEGMPRGNYFSVSCMCLKMFHVSGRLLRDIDMD
jgi:hypothetical protein